ncbi:MAG: PKD domain-containing protein, partial [Bacteroidia bacterium]|nr:PKD domain-containing protein [Bacteroidia bacterium]
TGFNGAVYASALQSDGELIVAGNFTTYNGVTRNRIARLNTDGSLDLTFDPLAGFSVVVKTIAIQADGKIVAGGGFSSYNGTIRYSVARINSDGTLDLTFNSTGSGLNGYVNSLVIQPSDGKIVVGGFFTSYNGTSRNRIVRLNTDGTLDLSFNPGSGYNDEVHTVKLNASEKIVTAGRYTGYNGTTRYGVSVLNSDGTLDSSFDPNSAMGGSVPCYSLAVQADGKILVSTINFGSNIYRFNTNGTSDGTFNTGGTFGGVITTLNIQPDGKILAGGEFNKGLRRLNSNGSNDFTVSGTGFGNYPNVVYTTTIQADGKIIVGGVFTNYNYSASRSNIARLNVCGSVVITTQPANVVACVTENAIFNLLATGSGLNYQWQEDISGSGAFSNLSNVGVYSGVNTPSLTITGLTSGMNNYKYRCIIDDGGCQTTSNSGTLTVNSAQVISSDPTDKVVCELSGTTFNAGISGTTLGLQWQEDQGSGFVDLSNGGIYSGVNTTTLSISNIPLSMNGYKFRLVASACSPVTSNFATLTVNAPPVIVSQPVANIGYCMPNTDPISMSLLVSGTGVTYQWQGYIGSSTYTDLSDGTVAPATFIAGGTYSGASTDALTINSPTPNTASATDPSLYKCVVSAGGCVVVSSLVTVRFYNTPSISSQPVDATKCSGSTGNVVFGISLSSVASGITYQWQEDAGAGFANVTNGGMYSGATSQNLTLAGASVMPSMNGYKYRCVVGACSPAVVSDEAILNVDEMPIITSQPQALTLCEGMDANFLLNATGNNLTYQWQEQVTCCTFNNLSNTGIYSGVNSDELLISPSSTSMNSYRYRCVVSSGSCSTTSNQPLLTVRTLPAFVMNPLDKVICEGGNTTMTASASNSYGAYQWQVDQFGLGVFTNLTDNSIYSGTNTSALSITGATGSMNGYIYRCVAGSCFPEVFSNSATLTVNVLPIITSDPVAQTICFGNNTNFSVSSVGGSHTYQWQCDFGSSASSWANISDNAIYSGSLTNALLLTTPPVSYNDYRYRCVVSSGTNCSTNSNDATLSITGLLSGLIQNAPSNNDPSVDFVAGFIPPAATTWYWDFGDGSVLSGNMTPTHVYTANGNYTACLIALNSCDSVAHCYTFSIGNAVGVDEIAAFSNISMYPNPTSERVVINGIKNDVNLTIYNTVGQIVFSTIIRNNSTEVDISDLENGMYYFELQDSEDLNKISRVKIIKIK